jgi:signal transduction histidine kinase
MITKHSLTTKILIWCSLAIFLSLAAFIAMYRIIGSHIFPYVDQMLQAERDGAIRTYEHGGSAGLNEYLHSLREAASMPHYLTDAKGIDLADGTNRSHQLVETTRQKWTSDEHYLIHRSSDGRFAFISVLHIPAFWTFVPFYLLVPTTVIVLGWLVTVRVTSPLKAVTATVQRFGAGDLAARINTTRKDEIGGVAIAFDQMANRIETLLHAERQLLQDISHELRSPLTRLSFAAALTKTSNDREAAAGAVQKEVDRLTELVSGLLQVTRLEGDLSARSTDTFSLESLLHRVIDDCRPDAEARHESLNLEVSGSAMICGNHELVRRAIENIVRNAVSYSPPDSVINVHLSCVGAQATITVRDFGPGVPPDELPKLFYPFYRVDPSRNNVTGGIGLGLAITRRAVALHAGSVIAENAGPGLRVLMHLPTASAPKKT